MDHICILMKSINYTLFAMESTRNSVPLSNSYESWRFPGAHITSPPQYLLTERNPALQSHLSVNGMDLFVLLCNTQVWQFILNKIVLIMSLLISIWSSL